MIESKSKRTLRKNLVPYVFILPFMISYVIFFLYPAIYSFGISFFSYKGYGSANFIGFKNYLDLFKYGTMWGCLGNTFFYFIFSFIPTMIFSFLLSILVRSKPVKRFQSFYKPILFLPQVCAIVASALCFKIIFGERVGVFSQLLGRTMPFLTDMQLMKWTVVVLITWRAIGWYFIIYLSGLTTISDEITEAASIDGANGLQAIRLIILPLMRPTFMLAFITSAIGSLKMYTEPNLMLAQNYDPPMQVAPFTNIIINSMSSGQFGMACAAGWILVFVILMLTLIQMKFFKGDE